MPENRELEELLERWDDLRQHGREVSAEELCSEHPELLAELKHRIHALTAMNWLLAGDSSDGDGEEQSSERPWQELPHTLGRYRLDELVGTGGFGQVWKAFDPELKRVVAIKVPRPDRLVSADRFLEEAQKVAQLRHPGIVPVYDVGRDGDWCFIVSDYIEGGNLSERFKDARPIWREAVSLVGQIADILDYAHGQGYVHRDIKPANILLDHDGKPHLADFGIAISPADLGHPVIAAGTLAFMSPEQLGGDVPSLDARTDIYALGVVLYWLVAGELPYVGESETQLRTAILRGERLSLKNCGAVVPGELEQVCCRALAREPVARFSTAREFADALRAIERPRWRRRAFGVVGLLLLLGLFAYFWKIGRTERPSAIEPSAQNGERQGEPREKEMTPEEVFKKLQEYADTHPPRPFQPDTTDVQKALNDSLGRVDDQTKAMVEDAREKIKGISPQAAKQLREVPIPRFSFPQQPDPPKGSGGI